ncbi:hypothetical protein ACTFBT_04020 [Streptomyces microflavus]|uniref:Exo-alpha-sialidase n=1 Tax=Streptomyces microflavus TaxID=1919 RepID=A0A7J0CJL5_STRMI|nr:MULTISPECIES: hypothetical protein [Streptomyces]WTC91375.1 hypothetical protein OH733_33630 [Streptomyces griseus]MDX2977607.1 hypothetical protein [Streptomyces sp. NRRL_B-2249]WSS38140.1 hypothetical protein OG269_33890 [Streptomyces microflavus]WST13142.1 hypothetical protein OG721_03755 [Streptomyces microflavus]WTD65993.1 hypothetical protein OH763_03365 [Streptomyces griseus]
MGSTTSPRHPRRLICLLSTALLLAACQSGKSDDRPGPDVRAMQWRQIPLTELPSAFFGVSARSLVASKDGFLLAVRPQSGRSELYRSTDGLSWKPSRPSAEQMTVDVLAGQDGDVIAGGRLFADGEEVPATMRYRGEGRWRKTELLPDGTSSDVVLATAQGTRGSVVVGHDGGPFEAGSGQKKGRSLRVWGSTRQDAFGPPHEVVCPQWPDQPPEVEALVDEDGFTVWARCRDAWGTSATFTLESSDGETWHKEQRHPAPLAPRADATSPSKGARVGQIVPWKGGYLALGSAESPARTTGALWYSPDGSHWTRATSGEDGFAQSVRVDAAAEYAGTLLAFGTDPAPDGHPPVRTRVWLGTPSGRPAKPIPAKGEGLQAVSGTWSWAQATLKVSREGRFTYRYRVMRDCATDAPPCDDVTTSTWGGIVTGTLAEGPRGAVQGRVSSSNMPEKRHAPGSSVRVTREAYDAVGLSIGPSVVGIFCRPNAYDERCHDVHG